MSRKRKIILFFTGIIILAIIIRIGIGEPCSVPSGSMEPAILPGDWLWIDKCTYGGRLPSCWADIPLVNAFTWIPFLREADAKNNFGYRRMPGFRKPKPGDVVVFNNPENPETLLVKRVTEITQRNGMNYYFMEGDNRSDSHDSRIFGYVPESAVVGKMTCVLFSFDDAAQGIKKWRIKRTLKKIS